MIVNMMGMEDNPESLAARAAHAYRVDGSHYDVEVYEAVRMCALREPDLEERKAYVLDMLEGDRYVELVGHTTCVTDTEVIVPKDAVLRLKFRSTVQPEARVTVRVLSENAQAWVTDLEGSGLYVLERMTW